MSKKFSDVAMNEHSKFEKATQRQEKLYSRKNDMRTEFGRDYTRILHSLAYRRLKHKTQFFFNTHNDHICTRMEHVAHVESISYTIAKELGLNVELTKAISTGHDLGHAPFGHQGESIISNLANKYLNNSFWHEKNGLRVVDKLELLEDNTGNYTNLNLTYAVRDGIICHCGEVDENGIIPRKEEENIELNSIKNPGEVQPYTWEGCVVKIADKIAYLGRDIGDAILLNIITDEDIRDLKNMAQKYRYETINTSVIIHELMNDLVENSSITDGICFSKEKLDFMNDIKQFNYKSIYNSNKLKYYKEYAKLIIESIFEELYKYYGENLEDTIGNLQKNLDVREKLLIKDFKEWIIKYCDEDSVGNYSINQKTNNSKIYGKLDTNFIYIEAIIDYISGMTDSYAIKCFNELISF